MEERLVPVAQIDLAIRILRGQKVLLDEDLAVLYGVETRSLIQAVKRNNSRFPKDFMFRLTEEEVAFIRSQSATLDSSLVQSTERSFLRSQIVILETDSRSTEPDVHRDARVATRGSDGRGRHRKYLPYAFTEQGVAMLSSVLRSPRAVQVNIEIMRAFVRLRRLLETNAELARQLAALEKKYDSQFRVVFDAIRQLMAPPGNRKPQIGFRSEKPVASDG